MLQKDRYAQAWPQAQTEGDLIEDKPGQARGGRFHS
jgi:hypothetical protein